MDLLKFILYILSRIGLMILVIVFGAFMGGIFFPALMSFLPYSLIDFKNFILDSNTQSVICLIISAAFLMRLFYADGKKHAAYEDWSAVNITIVYLLMAFAYFIPAIFRSSFAAEGKAELFYKVLYYPCVWLYEGLNMDFLVSVLCTSGILILLSLAMYVTAYLVYVKKHPAILNPKYAKENDDRN